MNKKYEKTFELGGRKLTLTTGILAEQASGAVMARYGDTVILATVTHVPLKQEFDYFPLSVEYQEKLYAGGKIKGSRWVKREGRPTDKEILTARLIDRSIRPLFPKDYKKEVQVIVAVLSVDGVNDPSILGAIAASAAVHITTLPWKGPVGVINVGLKDEKFIVNPVNGDLTSSPLNLVVSSTKDAVLMIEAGAKEVSEKVILDGVKLAFEEAQKINTAISELADEIGIKRDVYKEEKAPLALEKEVTKLVSDKIADLVKGMANHEGASGEFMELVNAVKEKFENESDKKFIVGIIDHLKKDYIREQILKKKTRPDGRKLTEIRKLTAEVGFLPRTHGSGLFTRGQTQVLSIATLGASSMGQLLETAGGEEEKRYMHDYSMPPFTIGEVGRVGNPGRREIGHGALAEKALIPVLPSNEEFPYAIRVVSEVLSSNGSTSMASVCGSSMALMDAGVPIKAPVAGIAMGLIIEGKDVAILSDIMGIEDFNGDMDFKVAGTEKGVTAIQLDVKTLNLTPSILKDALDQAKTGRAVMLKAVVDAIKEPRKEVSKFAPKIKLVKIPVEKIGELIGPGGKAIKKLMADTGTEVEVEDDGSVSISGMDETKIAKAIEWVEGLAKVVIAGEIYEGTVARIMPFGAFVNILPGKDGMVHVSDMTEGYVNDANDVVKIGDKVQVRVKEIDDMGRINLSMRMDPSTDKPKEERRPSTGGDRRSGGGFRGGGRPSGGFSRGSGSGRSFGGDRDRRPSTGGDDRRSSGPHFPTTRYFQTDRNDR
ncbi:polyribonucleotide nucleotidyltransferase [Candidatus Woesebacteria bacterium RIFOXYC1_FULL_31_51]|uniref:Polyribonucleotide nucleotidyltransferase n=1 Tax=Candidatus Woesebacteria bacterium GW2011_GWC2_31_9 TaxID=1618586 RepID=A0A0G0BJQ6_9BACT|nr:MAG: polyribonucleotide nucleotidyltransferase, polyribonucleotide nucleotidyltransferase [Candidatus Woesebacteria bacterium GW2011_GWF1_31_35]KKP23286.1 MAG: Polyribonucleotide nucleotidyltransferase [Candidatus Woesebacteria bacterium GW2011_GWC1_30_29]KKP26195.1 MAG: Polyribonucleotide nucleotidyltransferase [Candidatus Woesebacteria bacterium GW2011_GWD1_31_12]KKP27548.1 MAG: Polyribonucleotide nucleotidyltransferase [Candidatus Woesebacteria bacterium GW2011_GWB1_31_29]KKP31277.1 MAG: 